jgi:NADH:ubiquinone oxidoreductase subunit 4 (subunit M)
MARDDDNYDDELPADNMAGLANAMIILTGILLLIAIILMWKVTGEMYGEGIMA